MNRAIAWMVHNPVAANLLMLLLFLGGLYSAAEVQKEVEPPYELDVVTVDVSYPGASPAEVEQGILMPVESAVQGIQGVDQLTSTAREGAGSISLELVVGEDRQRVFQDVDQAVSRIRTFPEQAEQPEVALEARQRGVMEVGLFGPVDVWTLRILGRRLADQLRAHPDISQIELRRVPDFVTHVEVPVATLRAHGLTLDDIADAIGRSSQDIPAGAIEATDGEVMVRLKARRLWADDLAQIPIITADSGAPIRLGDLGTVTDSFEEVSFHSRFNGENSIEVQVYRVGDQSPLEVSAAVAEVMEAFEPGLPPGVQMRVDSNAAADFRARLGLLLDNGWMGLLVVLVILSLFLELRLAFWIMSGMAVSFVGGVLFLPMVGVSINMISMFAFLVVLGIVVDDAIVVGENIHARREAGEDPKQAAVQGAIDIGLPVVFSVLTTVVAFIPVMLLPGMTGLYWWPLPVVVILVLLLSLVEALLILPAHLAHAPRKPGWLARRIAPLQAGVARGLQRFVYGLYDPILQWCLQRRYLTLLAAVCLLVLSGVYATSAHMGLIMMPEQAADEIEAGVRLPVGTTRVQAARVATDLTDRTIELFDNPDLAAAVEGVKTNVRGENFIDVELVMRPPDERTLTARDVILLWRDTLGEVPGVNQIKFEAERGPGGHRSDVEIELSHDDMDELARITRRFVSEVERIEFVRDVGDSYQPGKTQLDIELLPVGQALGFDPRTLGRQVRAAFFGTVAMRQLRGTDEVEVRVELPEAERERRETLDALIVRTPAGAEVPLRDIAKVTPTTALTSIDRRNGRRVISVSIDAEPKRALGQILEVVRQDVLPALRADHPGLTWTFQGAQAEMRDSTQSLYGNLVLALVAIYALLAVAFRSYVQPLIVMSAIPFGAVGAVLGHMALGTELSLVSFMGMVALSGVVVNDSLIIVDQANRLRDTLPLVEAVRQAGLKRFRPILLTTLTTFGGLAPIIAEPSNQARQLIPMAISLGCGIVFATAIVLVLVPCLFLAVEDARRLLQPSPSSESAPS